MGIKRTITTKEELQTFAAELLAKVKVSRVDTGGEGPLVLALHGELGAGKTTFVQQLGAALGVSEPITSPTFLIMKHYPTEDPVFSTLTHIDAYRVEAAEEMAVLGFTDLLSDGKRLICIEWAERIESLLPPSTIHLTLALGTDDQRVVSLEGVDNLDT